MTTQDKHSSSRPFQARCSCPLLTFYYDGFNGKRALCSPQAGSAEVWVWVRGVREIPVLSSLAGFFLAESHSLRSHGRCQPCGRNKSAHLVLMNVTCVFFLLEARAQVEA